MDIKTEKYQQKDSEQNLAPIVLFTYKKLAPLKLTIKALQNNTLASKSELFIFSDGAKNESDKNEVNLVRDFLKEIDSFKKVTIIASDENKGLAKSIIEGVSSILKSHTSAIVLEDDLVTSSNFLDFMNEALIYYKEDSNIHSISGYTVPINKPNTYNYTNYFTKRASSWGWATWKNRWETVDWEVVDYPNFNKDKKQQKLFNKMGSDMTGMLVKQMNGDISSWAIRWCYDQFKKNQFTVFPIVSKIANIGFGENATHTKGSDNRFATLLDTSGEVDFEFNPNPKLDAHFIKQFTAKYSLKTRALYKVKNLLGIN